MRACNVSFTLDTMEASFLQDEEAELFSLHSDVEDVYGVTSPDLSAARRCAG